MAKSSERERRIRAQLRELIDRIAAELGIRKTVNEVVQAGLEEGCVLYAPLLPEVVAREMRRMARKQLGKSRKSGGAAATQPLFGFAAIRLPVHIVVPPPERLQEEFDDDTEAADEIDDEEEVEEDRWPWVVLQRATIEEGVRNVTYRGKLIEGAQKVRDRVNAVVRTAREAGGADSDVIGDILGPRGFE
jgi:hypothetical protein